MSKAEIARIETVIAELWHLAGIRPTEQLAGCAGLAAAEIEYQLGQATQPKALAVAA